MLDRKREDEDNLNLQVLRIDSQFRMAGELLQSSKLLCNILEQLRRMEKQGDSKDGVKYMIWNTGRDDHVDVYVRVSIVSVGDIDAVRQEFQSEFYMNLRWEERMLLGKDVSNEANIDWESIWDPGVYIIDAVNLEIYERHSSILPPERIGNPPQVAQYYHIKGTFKEVLEVNNFPFDYQDLSLILTSNWHADQLTLVKDDKKDDNIHTWNFYAKQEWCLRCHVITETLTLKPTEGSSGNSYPQYRVRMNVLRQYKFYIYNVALIMCLITLLTFTAFAVEPDSPGDRIQITLTLLLTSVAFKYYVQQFVPTVSYLTLLDKYVLACMVFQFCMALQNAISGKITNTAILSVFELASFILALVTFIGINTVFGCLSLLYIRKAKNQMAEDRLTYIKNNPGQMRIDLRS